MNKNDIFDQIIRIAVNSSLCEIRAFPKPGNIHRNRESATTTYENFLTVAYKMKDQWSALARSVRASILTYRIDLRDIQVNYKEYLNPAPDPLEMKISGSHPIKKVELTCFSHEYAMFLLYSVTMMMKSQTGGNVLLGHFLLLGPLFCAAAASIVYNKIQKSYFWDVCRNIISKSSSSDTYFLYQAIKLAKPGGMGKIEKYDINTMSGLKEIMEDQVNLFKAFSISKEYDMISSELVSGYEFIRNEVLPKMDKLIDEYEGKLDNFFKRIPKNLIQSDLVDISKESNEFVVRLFLYILGSKPDSLIMRKNPEHPEIAKQVSNSAMKLFDEYYSDDHNNWHFKLDQFDEQLHRDNGKMNPGTSADLLAAAFFVKFIYQYFGY